MLRCGCPHTHTWIYHQTAALTSTFQTEQLDYCRVALKCPQNPNGVLGSHWAVWVNVLCLNMPCCLISIPLSTYRQYLFFSPVVVSYMNCSEWIWAFSFSIGIHTQTHTHTHTHTQTHTLTHMAKCPPTSLFHTSIPHHTHTNTHTHTPSEFPSVQVTGIYTRSCLSPSPLCVCCQPHIHGCVIQVPLGGEGRGGVDGDSSERGAHAVTHTHTHTQIQTQLLSLLKQCVFI